jgi:hypothetical protein
LQVDVERRGHRLAGAGVPLEDHLGVSICRDDLDGDPALATKLLVVLLLQAGQPDYVARADLTAGLLDDFRGSLTDRAENGSGELARCR